MEYQDTTSAQETKDYRNRMKFHTYEIIKINVKYKIIDMPNENNRSATYYKTL